MSESLRRTNDNNDYAQSTKGRPPLRPEESERGSRTHLGETNRLRKKTVTMHLLMKQHHLHPFVTRTPLSPSPFSGQRRLHSACAPRLRCALARRNCFIIRLTIRKTQTHHRSEWIKHNLLGAKTLGPGAAASGNDLIVRTVIPIHCSDKNERNAERNTDESVAVFYEKFICAKSPATALGSGCRLWLRERRSPRPVIAFAALKRKTQYFQTKNSSAASVRLRLRAAESTFEPGATAMPMHGGRGENEERTKKAPQKRVLIHFNGTYYYASIK